MENENKYGFVKDFQEALIKNGAGRYDWLKDSPFVLVEVEKDLELLQGPGHLNMNVTGCSLGYLAKTMVDRL